MKLKNIFFGMSMATALVCGTPGAQAQNTLPDGAFPAIVTPHKQLTNYRERTLCYDITANVDYTATPTVSWITVRKGDNGRVYVHLAENTGDEQRQGKVVFANEANGLTQELLITQTRSEAIKDLPGDTQVKPSSATANTNQSGFGIEKSYDGDNSTFYHSSWSPYFAISDSNPVVLTYNFKNVERIDYINYTTRQDGQSNGNFGRVEVFVKRTGETSYTSLGVFDCGYSNYIFSFETPILNPASIQFKVYNGYADNGSGGYASCAEMQFMRQTGEREALLNLFADEALTQLKPEVTQADINNVDDSFVKNLAQQLFDGSYKSEYRIANYPLRLAPQVLSAEWNAPGKLYDQLDNPTGINIPKGTQAVAVSGLPTGVTLGLKVVAWYEGKNGGNFDGGNPQLFNYSLRNGLNTIDYTFDYDGLAYVIYTASSRAEYERIKALAPTVKVHFINGQVNGILTPDKTNDEMYKLCANAKSMFMDCYGKKVHSVWTSKGLKDYCRATDGKSYGYRQFMNTLDSLIEWEHDVLGFKKYGRVPDNHTFAYVNYTYYMFQGGLGVSFHNDQERRVLNCNTIINNDDDCIWGLSHEWGHQHQMHPYFCWGGVAEVSNNVNSYANIMRMGYKKSDKINHWPNARKHFLEDNEFSTRTKYSTGRKGAYDDREMFSWNSKLKQLCTAMEDSLIYPISENKLRGAHISDVGVGEVLCPIIMLYAYFTTHGKPDFAPDWYESLRQNDDENGSQIEKQGEVDKYELIASAQNSNKNGKLAVLRSKFPTSTWVVNNYITTDHCDPYHNYSPFMLNWIRKVSRLSGYNLFPYFEQWGYLRTIAMKVGDYGNWYYLLTQDMYDEFKADMDALVASGELKTMPDGLIEAISNTPDMFQDKPTIAN